MGEEEQPVAVASDSGVTEEKEYDSVMDEIKRKREERRKQQEEDEKKEEEDRKKREEDREKRKQEREKKAKEREDAFQKVCGFAICDMFLLCFITHIVCQVIRSLYLALTV